MSVADGEFTGNVQSVSRKLNGSVDVIELWDVPEEGPATFATNYRLSDDGSSLTVREIKLADREVPKPMTLIRCKAGHV